jgi:peptide deformylase
MIYQVIKYKNKKLRKKSKEIEIKSKINNVIKNMFETMKDKNGIGLAAPQIGKNIRLFIIKIRNKKKTFKKVFINPKIVNEFGKFCKYEEGCLSIPKIKIKIFRKENVTIEYFDQL